MLPFSCATVCGFELSNDYRDVNWLASKLTEKSTPNVDLFAHTVNCVDPMLDTDWLKPIVIVTCLGFTAGL
jgi:hypothetical protein